MGPGVIFFMKHATAQQGVCSASTCDFFLEGFVLILFYVQLIHLFLLRSYTNSAHKVAQEYLAKDVQRHY